MAPKYCKERIIKILNELSDIYSPSGYTHEAIKYIANLAKKAGIKSTVTNKGVLIVGNHKKPTLAITGHVDTLGLMVKEIRSDGDLNFTMIGGLILPAFEGQYVKIFSDNKKTFTGSLTLNNPASHVNKVAHTEERKDTNMHIRLDAEVKSAKDTEKLGINVGDFVAFESGFTFTDTGFVKSRFLDDKAGCAAMIEAFLTLGAEKLKKLPVCFFFSNNEEVGHGSSAGIPASVEELLVVDMGVVGSGVTGNEYSVSICAKDSFGPYDLHMRQKLTDIARKKKIPHRLDIFPFYASDGMAALNSGLDVRVALIGMGVSASHGNERTHIKGLNATKDLLLAYIDTL